MLTPGANGQANFPAVATTLVFEQCPVAMVVYDRALRVIASNEAMARLIGVSRSSIDGLQHIDDLRDQRHRRALQRALAGETVRYDSPYQATQSNVWFWASVTFAPLRDDAGDVIAAMCVVDAHPPRLDVDVSSSSQIQLSEARRLGRVGSWTCDNERQVAAASREFYAFSACRRSGSAWRQSSSGSPASRIEKPSVATSTRRSPPRVLLRPASFVSFVPMAPDDRSFFALK